MNYASLLALCSLMLLVPSCGKGGSTTTQEVKVEPVSEGTSVEVKEEQAIQEEAKAADKDKENLEEVELTEVIVKK